MKIHTMRYGRQDNKKKNKCSNGKVTRGQQLEMMVLGPLLKDNHVGINQHCCKVRLRIEVNKRSGDSHLTAF